MCVCALCVEVIYPRGSPAADTVFLGAPLSSYRQSQSQSVQQDICLICCRCSRLSVFLFMSANQQIKGPGVHLYTSRLVFTLWSANHSGRLH